LAALRHQELTLGELSFVPVCVPDLRDDRSVKGAIRIAVESNFERGNTEDQSALVHGLPELVTS
jgi:hypothetical protein